MATNTTNLSLIKPDLTDRIRIAQINQNMDIIDEKLGPVGSTSLQSQVTPLTTKTANYDKLIENGTDLNSLLTTGVYKSPATAAGVHTLLNCPLETPFVMVVRGEGEVDGCVQLLCGGVSIYTRRGTGSGFPAEWTVPTGGATPSGEYTIDDLYDAIDELLANAKDEIVAELVDDTAGEGDTGKVWSADKLATSFDEKANSDGYYEEMTVGSSEQLISTVSVQDSAPYLFRTSGGNADIGDREVDKLTGGTVAWNQNSGNGQISVGNWSGTTTVQGGITFTKNSDGSISLSGEATGRGYVYDNARYIRDCLTKENDIICVIAYGTSNVPINITCSFYAGSTWTSGFNTFNLNTKIGTLSKVPANVTKITCVGVDSPAGNAGSTVTAKLWTNMFNLTQMFGSTIADYIYSLEQATAGAGVAWFKRYFPKPYYAYNVGELMSVKALSHDTVGFNAWDEEWEVGAYSGTTGEKTTNTTNMRCKNAIPVKPNTAYYCKSPYAMYVFEYGADGTFLGYTTVLNNTMTTKANSYYIRFYLLAEYGTTYKNDICINLSWDGERDGEYEPYEKHSYSLGNVELRGIPKLDSDNKLYFDGDTYESNGAVTRKYGIVDLGTLTWAAWNPDTSLVFNASLPGKNKQRVVADCICPKYTYKGNISLWSDLQNGMMTGNIQNSSIYIRDNNYETKEAFAAAMSGVYLVYELATPTTETSDPFQNPQIVDDFGTEEYVDRGVATSARDVAIPVGHETHYQANLRAKLEMAPNSPADGDGDYIVRQASGINEYIKWDDSEIAEAIDAVEEAKEDKNVSAPAIIDTASGAIASFLDGADDRPIKHCIAQINPVQDLHGYDNPWPAGGGKNLINPALSPANNRRVARVTYVNGDNEVTLTTTSNVDYMCLGLFYSLKAGTYTIKYKATSSDDFIPRLTIYTNGSTIVTNSVQPDTERTFTLSEDIIVELRLFASTVGNGAPNRVIRFYQMQLEQGSTATVFAPYSNICPITGWTGTNVSRTGINQWDEEWVDGVVGTDGSIVTTGITNRKTTSFIPVLPSTRYYFVCPSSVLNGRYCFYDANKSKVEYNFNGFTTNNISVPSNAHYLRITIGRSYGTTYNHDISINYPATDTQYHAYSGQTYNITFPSEAGTVYGGTLDVVTGVLTVDWTSADMGQYKWGGSNGVFIFNLSNISPSWTRNSIDWMRCSAYKPESWNSIDLGTYSDCSIHGLVYNNVTVLRVYDSRYQTVTDFKSALSGVQFVYELATPVTYQLTPQEVKTLLGENNIFADTGDTSVSYRADTKLYIDKKFAELQAALNG